MFGLNIYIFFKGQAVQVYPMYSKDCSLHISPLLSLMQILVIKNRKRAIFSISPNFKGECVLTHLLSKVSHYWETDQITWMS